jgi:hypothetical protein
MALPIDMQKVGVCSMHLEIHSDIRMATLRSDALNMIMLLIRHARTAWLHMIEAKGASCVFKYVSKFGDFLPRRARLGYTGWPLVTFCSTFDA